MKRIAVMFVLATLVAACSSSSGDTALAPVSGAAPQANQAIVRVPVPAPQPLVATTGSVWVVGGKGLWRIDTATNTAKVIPGTQGAWWPAVGEGYAWVTTCGPKDTGSCPHPSLLKVSQDSGDVLGSVPLPNFVDSIAAGLGFIWISADGKLLKFSPDALGLVGTYDDNVDQLRIGGGFVWSTTGHGVEKIDPATGKVLTTVAFSDPCRLAASDTGVWVSSCQGGFPSGQSDRLMGIDPQSSQVTFSANIPPWNGELTAYGETVWLSRFDATGAAQVEELDPTTGQPTGPLVRVPQGPAPWIQHGLGYPLIFTAASDGSFWLTHIDGKDVVRVPIPSSP